MHIDFPSAQCHAFIRDAFGDVQRVRSGRLVEEDRGDTIAGLIAKWIVLHGLGHLSRGPDEDIDCHAPVAAEGLLQR